MAGWEIVLHVLSEQFFGRNFTQLQKAQSQTSRRYTDDDFDHGNAPLACVLVWWVVLLGFQVSGAGSSQFGLMRATQVARLPPRSSGTTLAALPPLCGATLPPNTIGHSVLEGEQALSPPPPPAQPHRGSPHLVGVLPRAAWRSCASSPPVKC